MIRAGTLIALILGIAASGASANEKLFGLIDARLSLMRDVAAWKAERTVPVEDLAREDVVLAKAVAKATELGLDTDQARAFFGAQITAAKDIQFCWLARWVNGAAQRPEAPADLVSDIRPELIALGDAILLELTQRPRETLDKSVFEQSLNVDCLSEEARDEVFDALNAVWASS